MVKIIFFIIVLITSTLFSQNILSGKITNKENGEPLPSVYISIPELNLLTVSDKNGNYLIRKLPAGIFNIKFNHIGFESRIISFRITASENKLNIELSPALIQTDEIAILGNSYSDDRKSSYIIEHMLISEIRNSGYLNLSENLSVLPGISEISNGVGIAKPVIRGLYGYRIAPVIAGLRFDNMQWQEEHGFGLDAAGIDNIQVILGPASLLYGAQSVGGVLNMVNEKNAPTGRMTGFAGLKTFSNTLGAKAEVGLKGSLNNWSWVAYADGESHADYLDGNNNRVPNTRFAGGSFNGTLSHFNKNILSELQYIFSYNVNGIVEETELNNPKEKEEEHFEREFEGPHHTVSYHIAALRNTYFYGNTKIKLNLGFQDNHRIEEEGKDEVPLIDQGDLDIILNTYSFDAQLSHSFSGGTEVTFATQGYFQKNHNEGGRILIPDADMSETGVAGYIKHDFGSIQIEGGIRYDLKKINTKEMVLPDSIGYMSASDFSYNILNGAAGLSIQPLENLYLKFNFATGYRAPNLAELKSNGIHEGTLRYEFGNESLLSEHNFEEDLSVTFETVIFTLTANIFNNNINNYIFLKPTGEMISNFNIFNFIQSDSRLWGGELSINLQPMKMIKFSGSYSTVIGKQNNNSYLPFMPADKIIAGITYFLPDVSFMKENNFHFTTRSYLKMDRPALNEASTPGYVLCDAGIGSSIDVYGHPLRINLNVTNLLGKNYMDHLSLLRRFNIHNMGRNISLSLNLPFE